MQPGGFDLDAYLERIGLEMVQADAAGLHALQEAHMRAIPFENFDPLLGKVPSLEPDEVFDKLVRKGRGGYCFEQNGLFEAALRAVGFLPRRRLARVRMRFGPEAARSHLVLLVEVEGETWLADAGFGGPGPLAPLRLGFGGEQVSPSGSFRIAVDGERGETVLERFGEDGWVQLYAFDGARVTDLEVASANYFCATWDQVPFGFHVVVGAWASDLRYGLFDRQLSVSRGSVVEHSELVSLDEFSRVVTGKIGIALDMRSLERAWRKIAPPG